MGEGRPARRPRMKSLIAKLEQASEGNRELDVEVAWAIGRPGSQIPGHTNEIPHYTTSLDAKLPGENITQVALHDVVEGEPLGAVWEAWRTDPKTGHQTMGAGQTEALARRIASLKARE